MAVFTVLQELREKKIVDIKPRLFTVSHSRLICKNGEKLHLQILCEAMIS